MVTLNPANCELRQIYKLMTGIIVPRPVALVSTMDRHGVANLAPFSAFPWRAPILPRCFFALRCGTPAGQPRTASEFA